MSKSDLVRLRHILIHEYFGVSEKVVWDTVQEDLPKLKEQIAAAIAMLERQNKKE